MNDADESHGRVRSADALAASLQAACPGLEVWFGQDMERADPGVDRRNLRAEVIARPRNEADVVRITQWSRVEKISLVAQGGRTSDTGCAATVAGQVIVSFDRMNKIEAIDPLGKTAIVQAGVTLHALAEAARIYGLSPGIDIGSRGSCTLGGMIATNAGGADAFRYGTMRRRVLGLEAILPDGSTFSDLTRVIKTNTGFDLKHLFIGSEGTLGFITRAALWLESVPDGRATALVALQDWGSAIRLVNRLGRDCDARASKLELFSWNQLAVPALDLGSPLVGAFVRDLFGSGNLDISTAATNRRSPVFLLIELEDRTDTRAAASLESVLTAASSSDDIVDALLPKNEREVQDVWRVREEWVIERLYQNQFGFDVAVPLSMFPSYVERLYDGLEVIGAGLRLFLLGHLGDGNLHITVNSEYDNLSVREKIAELVYGGLQRDGGSFSAEHGIGLEKKGVLSRYGDPTKSTLMRQIKHLVDPSGIFNPGKVID